MGMGLSFQPGAAQTQGDANAATSALGPGQRALKILALHLPQLAAARGAVGSTAPAAPKGPMSPDQAVYEALVSSLGGAPVGGHPTTPPIVAAMSDLPSLQGVVPSGQTGTNLGPNGEWQPGVGELAPPTPDGQGVGGNGIVNSAAPGGLSAPGGSHISEDVWRHLITTLGRVGAPRGV